MFSLAEVSFLDETLVGRTGWTESEDGMKPFWGENISLESLRSFSACSEYCTADMGGDHGSSQIYVCIGGERTRWSISQISQSHWSPILLIDMMSDIPYTIERAASSLAR